MATQKDLGRVRLVWKGDYDSNMQYEFLDAVSYFGSSYVCYSSQLPPKGTLPTSAEYWAILALKGVKGDTGKDFKIVKTYTTIAAMQADFSNPSILEGDFVIITSATHEQDPDNARLYVKGKTEFNFITDLSGSQGIKGDTGAKGDKGDQGIAATITVGTVTTGAAGTQASITNVGSPTYAKFNFVIPKGDKGDKGDDGDAATIEIGTVSTGNAGSTATITNSGTIHAAVLNFTIPKGDRGIQGVQGTQGVKGDDGVSVKDVTMNSDGHLIITLE